MLFCLHGKSLSTAVISLRILVNFFLTNDSCGLIVSHKPIYGGFAAIGTLYFSTYGVCFFEVVSSGDICEIDSFSGLDL